MNLLPRFRFKSSGPQVSQQRNVFSMRYRNVQVIIPVEITRRHRLRLVELPLAEGRVGKGVLQRSGQRPAVLHDRPHGIAVGSNTRELVLTQRVRQRVNLPGVQHAVIVSIKKHPPIRHPRFAIVLQPVSV